MWMQGFCMCVPALNLKDPSQERLVREITEQVVVLTRKYKGLLWGEHGKGVRSEFSPEFFGPLYPTLQAIKAAFDPLNQLNPGKIATPDSGELLKSTPYRLEGSSIAPFPSVCRLDSTKRCTATVTELATITILTIPCARRGRVGAIGDIRLKGALCS